MTPTHLNSIPDPATAARTDATETRNPREQLLAGLPVTEERLSLAGIPTVVLRGGHGVPLVLLHGPGEYALKWFRILPDLTADFSGVAPDLPGHGASDAPDEPFQADRILAWLDELIDRTCASAPVVVGQIIGGAIAARHAAARGDRLRRLVLVDALGLGPFQPAPEFGAALGAFVAEPTPENHDRLWQRCAYDLDTLRRRMGRNWDHLRSYNLDRARAPRCRRTLEAMMLQFGFPAIAPEELARIKVPVDLIWGRHDLATPLRVAEAESARHGWRLHVIEAAADDPPLEQPEAFVRILRALCTAK